MGLVETLIGIDSIPGVRANGEVVGAAGLESRPLAEWPAGAVRDGSLWWSVRHGMLSGWICGHPVGESSYGSWRPHTVRSINASLLSITSTPRSFVQ